MEKDLDLGDEQFITASEMLGYCNAAIDEAESEILTLNEDYFLTSYVYPWTTDVGAYALPADIYGQKIREFVYANGSIIYEIKRLKMGKKFGLIADILQSGRPDDYRYYLTNPSVGVGFQMNIVPAPRETASVATLWYIRNAARVAVDADFVDIPEFANFIMEYMKAMCRAKENGGEMLPVDATRVEQQRKQMVDTLKERTPDEENLVEMDLSAYYEQS